VGETVALLVQDGQQAVCLAAVESRFPIRVGYEIGERMPLHASAGGQVLLANMPEPERRAVYAAGLPQYTPRTLTDADALEARLANIRTEQAGWAEDSYYEGVLSAAAPVIDPKKRLAGAVSIAAPMSRRGVADLPELAAAARRAATAITAEWGGQPGTQRLATPNW
jgi:DNA-binding IclR family transcriptional regulator